MAYIPLTRGLRATIDAADISLVEGSSWTAKISKSGSATYAIHGVWDTTRQRQRNVSLHRLIMDCPDGLMVDHINGDGLDNRRANLRVCTARVNQNNRFYHRDPSLDVSTPPGRSGQRGVYLIGDAYTGRVSVGGRMLDVSRNADAAVAAADRDWAKALIRRPAPESDAEVADLVHAVLDRPGIAHGVIVALLRRATARGPSPPIREAA